jgi:hypothetical protein
MTLNKDIQMGCQNNVHLQVDSVLGRTQSNNNNNNSSSSSNNNNSNNDNNSITQLSMCQFNSTGLITQLAQNVQN